jgi:parallel beta-helix repeat protein
MCPNPTHTVSRFLLFSVFFILFSILGVFIDFYMGGGQAGAAPAITIRVNTTLDNNLSDLSISLREAILLVNGGTGGDGLRTGLNRPLSSGEAALISGGTIGPTGVAANIVFTDLPGLSTIALAQGTDALHLDESLPPIMTSGVVINGLNGAGGRMTIDGSGVGAPAGSNIFWLGWADGVGTTIQVSDITLRSLIVTGAKKYGIFLNPARASLVAQCDVRQSANYALFIQGKFGNADGNIIEDCTIGNNAFLGVVVNRPGAFNNIIRNNRIGTDTAGTTAAPNTGAGIALFTGTHDNSITGNLISGNTLQGIYIDGSSVSVTSNIIQGNRIGTKADGTTALPNVQGVVLADGCLNNLIGGTGAGEGNIIAFNTQSGIVAVGNNTRGNRFSRNSIFQNTLLGIDLLDDKLPTPGISGGGVGPNQLAMRPTLIKAQASGAFGVFSGTASPNSTIEIFISDGSLSGFGSGKIYCATTTANTAGAFNFVGSMACTAGVGTIVTATSTLSDNSTSEFGNNLTATKLPELFLPLIQR